MYISELLSMPQFADFKLLTNADYQDREITTVNVIDSPDSYKYFKGGELLLTNTFIMQDNLAIFLDILENSARLGVAGLGVKLERFLQELPQEVIERANQLRFPIILVPLHYAFADIINPVLRQIISQQVRQLSFSEMVHKSFTKLVLEGGDIGQIIKTLSELLHQEVYYYDTVFHEIYYSKGSPPSDLPSLNELLSRYEHYPIDLDKRKYGYLLLAGRWEESNGFGDIAEYRGIAAEHAATVLKLSIQKKISNRQVESKYRDIFVQGLLTNQFTTLDEIKAQAALYHWNLEQGMLAVVLEHLKPPQPPLRVAVVDGITAQAKVLLRNRFRLAIYTKIGEQIIFLLAPLYADPNHFRKQVDEACQTLKQEIEQDFNVCLMIGVGRYKASLLEVRQSYEEALQAINVGRDIQTAVCFYDKLGLYRLLAPLAGTEAARQFQEQYLQPLLLHDAQYRSEYLPTLRALATTDWNLQQTAQKLYIHYNTVKNRYRKIGELLELDLANTSNRIDLTIALKLMLLSQQDMHGE